MNCKFCDTPLADGQATCPTCGRAAHEQSPQPPEEKPHLPKDKRQRAIFFSVLALLLVVVGVIAWRTLAGVRQAGPDQPVVTCEAADFSLSNTELGYYYWSEYFYFIDSSGSYLPASLDPSKPLEEQMYDQQTTWHQHILEKTLETVRSTMAMVFAAQEAGFTLDAGYEASLQTMLDNFAQSAQKQGFTSSDGAPDVQAYLADSFGEGATLESFTAYLRNSYLAAAYADALFAEPTFTDQELSDYYDRFAADYAADGLEKDTQTLRTLRTVLLRPIDPADEQSWQTARDSAENLYAAWRSESGTEADFAAMAQSHSADIETASQGGLLEQARRQELTGELAAWAFDPARQESDTAILRTDEGWAITYYVTASTQTAWQRQAELDLRAETYQNALRTLLSQYEFQVAQDEIRIATPGGLYSGATQSAAQPVGD